MNGVLIWVLFVGEVMKRQCNHRKRAPDFIPTERINELRRLPYDADKMVVLARLVVSAGVRSVDFADAARALYDKLCAHDAGSAVRKFEKLVGSIDEHVQHEIANFRPRHKVAQKNVFEKNELVRSGYRWLRLADVVYTRTTLCEDTHRTIVAQLDEVLCNGAGYGRVLDEVYSVTRRWIQSVPGTPSERERAERIAQEILAEQRLKLAYADNE
jgi:hypothetical protein